MADTWKQLLKLSIDFRAVFELLQYNDIQNDLLDWIELFIQKICEIIAANVQTMMEVRYRDWFQNRKWNFIHKTFFLNCTANSMSKANHGHYKNNKLLFKTLG